MIKKTTVLLFLFFVCFNITAGGINAYDSKTYNWSFKPAKDNKPVTTESLYIQMLEDTGGFFIGDTTKKELYLTFDNGYENGYTEKILDVLKEKEVPAAFFVTGHYLDSASDLVVRMVNEGHIVGNHSWHHPSLPEIGEGRLMEELTKVKNRFTELTGEKEMNYLRPPRGQFSERSLALSAKLGYTNVFWSMAYKDWEVNNQKGGQYAYDQIMKRIHPGAIMLIHSISSDNAEALPKVIDEARKQGYTFKSLDDYMFSQKIEQLPFP
ncbi:polysaccharide deacetylase for xylans/chitin [Alkalihalophilus pseudofirmus OF4]|uniref:Polysaccharide deacetylase for xylans/chitin n=1 Tax=Alkalihalophilus pseudofirmus (strain ATCC BAA-2126 / JCM 17055 / OF4) TaxID=398511 RepID=D3FUM1_ALKPO|nr:MULTISPECIES: delta-lactam-biosynthetic de-N-acetylase [Alkalihalophilus]ADC50191.1 polysaccharide deacetylase for xylans/chitin [Alkalihalophilus pseudofirmus OF4]MED1599937.1 delta-lactam-biosynthetic de-N-acetylase [Alkalihalophilus marmarensis]